MGYYVLKKAKNTPALSMSSTLSTFTQQYYFVLKATNGEVIATSEMYNSKQVAENGIRSVQSNGSTTDIRDET
ncbi:YegP family protein [Pantoea agglomerans]|uniref:YegP family protein n=1 Tax=Enterobacter agglomerans TaxID=549 RepID=UPI00289E7804|nr:YegP family protein [Pantoea agglomerans]WNK43038.1 YegP family protein [Pantoea agglomerans]